ncbi:MAG: PEGA domain-containing protein, partial [Acidobacteriota bacterium]
VTACALLFQFGACTYSTKPQKIPVTSNPVGAKVFADGKEMGVTPFSLSLKKDVDHTIRIEKPGYNPVDIQLVSTQSKSPDQMLMLIPVLAGIGAAVGLVLEPEDGYGGAIYCGIIGGALIGLGLWLASSLSSAKARRLTPTVLRVRLEKAQSEAQTRTHVVILDRDQLKDIRWIRISCAEGGAEEVVAVN